MIKELKAAAKKNGNSVSSIAEFMGKENNLLEIKGRNSTKKILPMQSSKKMA